MSVAQVRMQRGVRSPWVAFARNYARASTLTVAIAILAGCTGQVQGSPGNGIAPGNGVAVNTGGQSATPGNPQGGGAGVGSAVGGSSPNTAGSAATNTTGGAATLDCSTPHAAAVHLQLLSENQYNNTVLDMLQVGGDPGKNFTNAVFDKLDDTAVEQRANAASSVAQQAVAVMSKWSPCVPPATGDTSACEAQIISKVGANAFRRPLLPAENAKMKTLFDAGIKEKDFSTGVEWFLTGILQAPDFMYQVTQPAADEAVGQARPLAPYEYASRLSYMLWNSMPDDKLFAAAGADELSDPAKRQVHLTRMIADARFMRGVQAFYSQWLNLAAFGEVARNDPGFTGDIVTALSSSLLLSATQLYSSATPNFSSLFSGNTYYMNDALRTFYGLAGSGTSFSAVTMNGEGRQGIVTHPALMALLSRPGESNPIARGLFMVRTLVCGDVPPPPAGLVIPELAPVQDGLSTRDRLEAHVTNALCMSCHKLFDPPGFALENYDEVGKYRTVDHGKAVDTSGTVALRTDLDGDFANGGQLLTKMASSPDVKSCFAQNYLRFALSRQQFQPEDQCSAQSVGTSFVPSGDLKQLVVTLVGSDAFRLRLAEGVGK